MRVLFRVLNRNVPPLCVGAVLGLMLGAQMELRQLKQVDHQLQVVEWQLFGNPEWELNYGDGLVDRVVTAPDLAGRIQAVSLRIKESVNGNVSNSR